MESPTGAGWRVRGDDERARARALERTARLGRRRRGHGGAATPPRRPRDPRPGAHVETPSGRDRVDGRRRAVALCAVTKRRDAFSLPRVLLNISARFWLIAQVALLRGARVARLSPHGAGRGARGHAARQGLPRARGRRTVCGTDARRSRPNVPAAATRLHGLSASRPRRRRDSSETYPRRGRGVAAIHERPIRVTVAASPRFVGDVSARRSRTAPTSRRGRR